MQIALFILGILLSLSAVAWITYVIFSDLPEEYFYRSFLCICGFTLFTIAFSIWGGTIFSQESHKWMLFSISVFFSLFIVFYVYGYIEIGCNDFEARLLLLLIPLAGEAYFIISTFFAFDFQKTLLTSELTPMFIAALGGAVLIIAYIVTRKRLKETERKLRALRRRTNSSINEIEITSSNSRSDRTRIEQAIIHLYTLMQEDLLTPSRAIECLHSSGVPSIISSKMMERIFETSLYRNASVISIMEFAQEVLPEYYKPETSLKSNFRNSSMDIRMFEDLYDRFRRLTYSGSSEITQISLKLDNLLQVIELDDKQQRLKNVNTLNEAACQNQIRELFHALETPLALTELTVYNLRSSFNTLSTDQERKLIKVQNNLKVIKCILYAYRELTFMTIWNAENTFLPLPDVVSCIKEFLYEHETSKEIEIRNLPSTIENYSTNLITILMLPLLQNAFEATPDKNKVVIQYSDDEKDHVLEVVNYCTRLPNQKNLNTEGYSSKGEGHEGTGISIVRRISTTAGISFNIHVKSNQVCAALTLPKKINSKESTYGRTID